MAEGDPEVWVTSKGQTRALWPKLAGTPPKVYRQPPAPPSLPFPKSRARLTPTLPRGAGRPKPPHTPERVSVGCRPPRPPGGGEVFLVTLVTLKG